MSGEVIMLQPKLVTGKKRNVTWAIKFDRVTRTWSWAVTVQMAPQTIEGSAKTEADARLAVDAHMAALVR
jgi:hypothetical protein